MLKVKVTRINETGSFLNFDELSPKWEMGKTTWQVPQKKGIHDVWRAKEGERLTLPESGEVLTGETTELLT